MRVGRIYLSQPGRHWHRCELATIHAHTHTRPSPALALRARPLYTHTRPPHPAPPLVLPAWPPPHTHPRLQQYAREARVQYSETHKDLNGLGTFAKLPMMERLLDRLSDVATPVSEQVY